MQLGPDRFVPGANGLGGSDRVVEVLRPFLERRNVGEPEGDVLDKDLEIVRALAIRQGRVDLACLGVDEERLDPVAVAPEQRVREEQSPQ